MSQWKKRIVKMLNQVLLKWLTVFNCLSYLLLAKLIT